MKLIHTLTIVLSLVFGLLVIPGSASAQDNALPNLSWQLDPNVSLDKSITPIERKSDYFNQKSVGLVGGIVDSRLPNLSGLSSQERERKLREHNRDQLVAGFVDSAIDITSLELVPGLNLTVGAIYFERDNFQMGVISLPVEFGFDERDHDFGLRGHTTVFGARLTF